MVLKMFDTFTEQTFGVLQQLYSSFERLCLFRPLSSRPACSERYCVLAGKLARPRQLTKHDTAQLRRFVAQQTDIVVNEQSTALARIVHHSMEPATLWPFDHQQIARQLRDRWSIASTGSIGSTVSPIGSERKQQNRTDDNTQQQKRRRVLSGI